MMQIKCEMCGSSDLVKEDSLYVCKHCGMKYSPEEAKKMMVEIEGAVKIDDTEELANLYVLARRAVNDKKDREALKYYDMILIKDPTSWEAAFNLLILHAQEIFWLPNFKAYEMPKYCDQISQGVASVIVLVKDTVSDIEEQKNCYNKISSKIVQVTDIFYSQVREYKGTNLQKAVLICCARAAYTFALELKNAFPDREFISAEMNCIEQGVAIHSLLFNNFPSDTINNENERNTYYEFAQEAQRYNPNFIIPKIPEHNAEQIAKQTALDAQQSIQVQEEHQKKQNKKAWIILIIVVALVIFLGPTIIGLLLNLILGGIGSIFGI